VRDAQRGFTLLEVLVALAVLATSMGAVIQAVGEYTRNQLLAVQLEQRWPSVGQEKGDAELPAESGDFPGREWRWEMQVIQTAEPDLRRLDIEVFNREADDDAAPLARLSGFMERP
jgi:general secretion pathway protein I